MPRWFTRLSMALGVGVGLAVLGPYGTYHLPMLLRLLYWVVIVGLNWVQVVVLIRVMARVPAAQRWPAVMAPILAACVASLVATGEVMLLEQWLRPSVREAAGAGTIEVYALVLVITVPVTLLAVKLNPLARVPNLVESVAEATAPITTQTVSRTSTPGAFHARLPAQLRGDLLCLRSEDHYLRVHTSQGDALILMRMSDAEQELAADCEGLRVHRSWWVAQKAVLDIERRATGGMILVLSTGHRVPVGRSYLGAVRSAGWINAS